MSTHRKLWLSPLHRAEWEHAEAFWTFDQRQAKLAKASGLNLS